MEQSSLRTIRNQVEWKSDNDKIKETTSIQTRRSGPDAECGMGWSLTHVWWIKIRRGIWGARSHSLIPEALAQGSSARKISPYNFWLQKPVGIELVEETSGAPSSSS